MLSLNIIDQDYMCIDIATDSVIHKHLLKKLHETITTYDEYYDPVSDSNIESSFYSPILKSTHSDAKTHNLTTLDRFHISLGPLPTPRKSYEINVMCGDPIEIQEDIIAIKPQIIPISSPVRGRDLNQLIGDITLSDIYVSETENKKSAWIRLTDFFQIFFGILDCPKNNENPILRQLHYSDWEREYVDELHISLANLTGKPRDSISRPENCIIDTITN